jgi:uncharacterized protein
MGWIATLFMGVILGLLGGGGGILTVPILVGFFGIPATSATGSSLLVVGLTSLVGGIQGIVKKQCEVGSAVWIALPSMVGAIMARRFVVPSIPSSLLGVPKDHVLLSLFALLLLIVGIRMLATKKHSESETAKIPIVVSYGFLIGILSGTLGAGGGFLILPALTMLLGVELEKAIPTSLLVITLQSLAGFAGELGKPIQWNLLMSIAGVALIGMVIGLLIRDRVPRKHLQIGFAYMLFFVAIWMVSKIL